MDVQEIIILDDDDFGQGEQLKRDPQLVEEAFEELKANESSEPMERLFQLTHKDKNRALMRQLGTVPILCNILSKANPPELNGVQASALKLLASMLKNLPTRDEVRKKGGIDIIVKLIKLKDEVQLSYVFQAASFLADNPKNRNALRQCGILEAAIPKMNGAQPVVLQNILQLITGMSTGDKKTQELVVKLGAVPKVLDAILDQNTDTRRYAIDAIGAVTTGNRKVQALVRKNKQSLQKLVSLLQDPIADNREQAAFIIGVISENDYSNQVAFERIGVVNAFSSIIDNPNESLSVKEKVCGALVALSNGNAKIQKAWVNYGGLLGCTICPCVGTQAQAFHAISELCANNSVNSDEFINVGILPIFENAFRSENEIVQYRAAGALYSIIRGNPGRKQIVFERPNTSALLKALKGSGNPKVKQGAEWCLEELV